MYIQEAVKEAVEINSNSKKKAFIRRADLNSGMLESQTYIYPTNSYDCCVGVNFSSITRRSEWQSRFWNPTANDLTADDWEVVTME